MIKNKKIKPHRLILKLKVGTPVTEDYLNRYCNDFYHFEGEYWLEGFRQWIGNRFISSIDIKTIDGVSELMVRVSGTGNIVIPYKSFDKL